MVKAAEYSLNDLFVYEVTGGYEWVSMWAVETRRRITRPAKDN